ncbi:uncharacterized protein [Diabrotica undecimpunctata]|uniref:uncharacterized protein n=1 Tax=Diabrotica undecimpunctata TaxID=50387 RepID=UPI003B632462
MFEVGDIMSYLSLLEKVTPVSSDATIEDVRKKINTLLSDYRKEQKKIKESKRSGAGADELYSPTSWVYYALQFLDKHEKPQTSHLSIIEKEVELPITIQPEQFSTPSTSSINSLYQEQLSKQQKRRRNWDDNATKQSKLLSLACSYLSKQGSNANLDIAKVWATKLEKLHPQQKLFAEKAINDILFEEEMGQLQRYSVRINEYIPSPTTSVYTYVPTPSPTSNTTLHTFHL